MLRKIRLFLVFVIAQGFWLCSASATTVLFYNVTGDVLAVDFYCSPGDLKGGNCGFGGFGEAARGITLNGEVLKPYFLSQENEPAFSFGFSSGSFFFHQAWHDGTRQNPGQIYGISVNASGPFGAFGDKSLEEYRGLATGTATGIGAIYSIGQYPVPIPGTSVLLGLGLVGLCAARRKQA